MSNVISKGEEADSSNEMYLVTAAGRIRCLRCTAKSSRTKLQCRKPALKVSRTQKCGFHGGQPHSAETLKRIAAANTVHGEATKASKERTQRNGVLLRELEDAMHLLGMAQGPRTRGRKPNGYIGVHHKDDVMPMLLARLHHM